MRVNLCVCGYYASQNIRNDWLDMYILRNYTLCEEKDITPIALTTSHGSSIVASPYIWWFFESTEPLDLWVVSRLVFMCRTQCRINHNLLISLSHGNQNFPLPFPQQTALFSMSTSRGNRTLKISRYLGKVPPISSTLGIAWMVGGSLCIIRRRVSIHKGLL